jgi:hypothetical protein
LLEEWPQYQEIDQCDTDRANDNQDSYALGRTPSDRFGRYATLEGYLATSDHPQPIGNTGKTCHAGDQCEQHLGCHPILSATKAIAIRTKCTCSIPPRHQLKDVVIHCTLSLAFASTKAAAGYAFRISNFGYDDDAGRAQALRKLGNTTQIQRSR